MDTILPDPSRQSALSEPLITITAAEHTIAMGHSARIEARVSHVETPGAWMLLPFVNGRRWGAHERPDAQGRATFLLPLPNPGAARIQVLALPIDTTHWMGLAQQRDLLLAGRWMPDPLPARTALSNTIALEVSRRAIAPPASGGTLFGMQWEPWFTGGVPRWETAQAVPLTGFYDSYNRDVTRQHLLWLMDIGADFILIDWTNHLWGRQHWDERPDHVNALLHATQLALEVMAEMRDEGLPVPKAVLFPGLSNGRPTTMQALNEELSWIYHAWVRNPRFAGLWLDFDDKPLVVVLDTAAIGDPRATSASALRVPFFRQTLEMSADELDAFRAAQPPVDETYFTVRWMSSQNEVTRHHELGYWSWMDGTLEPPVTWRNGQAEAVTASVGIFGPQGWLHESAHGRRRGATFIDTFRVALRHRPRVVFLHQFNEYSGQPEGHGFGPDRSIYVDTYDVERSDDIEPTSLTAPGYRGDTGGWGFYYLNLTRALIDLYRGRADDCALLAVSAPLRHAIVSGPMLRVEWSALGAPVRGFSVLVDDQLIRADIAASPVDIDISGLPAGAHTVSVVAQGVGTRYPLSCDRLDTPRSEAMPARVDVPFILRLQP